MIRQQDKQWLWLRVDQVHLNTFATVQNELICSEAILAIPMLSKSLNRIDTENKKWDVQQFSVKSLDYVEELQHPWRMKHCTQQTFEVLLNKA